MARALFSRKASLALFFAAMTVVGLVTPAHRLIGVNQHMFLAVNVLALNFCLGLGGQISLAQAAFAGIGAYASVLLHARFPGATLLIAPAVVVGVGLLAALVSRPMERLGEGFLAMATLCVSLVCVNVALTMESVTGGAAGMMVEAKLALPGIGALGGDRVTFFLFLLLLALGAYVFLALRDSRLGRALAACRDDRHAASSLGIDRPAVRAVSFGLGGGLSAAAGVVHGHYTGFISPEQFSLELSLKALLFLVIGGPGNLLRPILAALVLETAMSRLQFLGDARTLVNGLLLGAALLAGYWRARR
ncbi:branched-chain amino acid ABC transporter permease [Solidesulfovibrio sp.]|uniref:branched-chain amino acid ABC transporter permease n=1 Tax=Solidesulfovibrio sp. TaxID=2910990 RepID=UPI002B20B56C|nr:branched-chain amino acid ABC transporter permease [Solidesulfovibrio sp.]MEA5087780.1 branched-chain amino acid ABC transporter permease [Solidesulfovibrio sp.]HML61785.1 branched-chain amino acid ABC transporter permease [Solidesulfovibrio sp.]